MRNICALLISMAMAAGASAQTVTITGSHLGGTAPVTGVITLQPTLGDAQATQASAQMAGGGITSRQSISAPVSNGSFSVTALDTNLSNPKGLCYNVTVRDRTNAQILGPGFSCVQPAANNTWCSKGVCNFDLYIPSIPTVPAQLTGPVGPPGPGCATGAGECDMSVPVSLPADPTQPAYASTKRYVDAAAASHIASLSAELQTAGRNATTNAAANLGLFINGGKFWGAGAAFVNQGAFADDGTLAYIAAPAAFDAVSEQNIVGLFLAAANASGATPVVIYPNGTANTFYSQGFDNLHAHVSGDGPLMLPQAEYRAYQQSGTTASISAHIAGLATALGTIPVNPSTNLCTVASNSQWAPWLFEESFLSTGDVTMCSIWLARDYQVMSAMYSAIGDATDANTYAGKLSAILSSLSGTSSPLWDSTKGIYRLATLQNSTVGDVDGSALACYFGFATPGQCTSISTWLVSNYPNISRYGLIRQVDGDVAFCGVRNADGSQTVETTGPCASGFYQQGVWAVQLGWVAYTMALTNASAAKAAIEAYLNQGPVAGVGATQAIEWVSFVDANHGTASNLESTMGAYDFISNNPALFSSQNGVTATLSGSSNIAATAGLDGEGAAANTPACWDGRGNVTACRAQPSVYIGDGGTFIAPPAGGVITCVASGRSYTDCANIFARSGTTGYAGMHLFTGASVNNTAAAATGFFVGLMPGDGNFHIRAHGETVDSFYIIPGTDQVVMPHTVSAIDFTASPDTRSTGTGCGAHLANSSWDDDNYHYHCNNAGSAVKRVALATF